MVIAACAALKSIGAIYTLSGSTGDRTATCTTSGATSARSIWTFQSAGGVVYDLACANTTYQSGVEWIDAAHKPPATNIWIRATADTGSVPNDGSDALNTWLVLVGPGQSNKSWKWFRSFADPGTYQGSVKVELSTDSSGTNIIATGWYGGTATANG